MFITCILFAFITITSCVTNKKCNIDTGEQLKINGLCKRVLGGTIICQGTTMIGIDNYDCNEDSDINTPCIIKGENIIEEGICIKLFGGMDACQSDTKLRPFPTDSNECSDDIEELQ